ncbi:MAG: hypothetical protein ABI647_03560 [Gemmatimonadota bacterium]
MKSSSVLAFILGLSACTGPTESGWTRALGLVDEGTPPFTGLTAPDTVRARRQFEITVRTFGSSSCTRPDGYDLVAAPLRAEVRPYDLTAPLGSVCTEDYGAFPRTVPIRFEAAGIAEIVVEGHGFDGASRQVRKAVTVLPE